MDLYLYHYSFDCSEVTQTTAFRLLLLISLLTLDVSIYVITQPNSLWKTAVLALLKTVSVSPRIAPKPSIIAPEISSTACDKAFFALVNSITPFIFWRHCSTSDIKFSLRTEMLEASCL